MYHQIITHNHFLKSALHTILNEIQVDGNYCIIDLDCLAGLNEIYQYAMRCKCLNFPLFLCGSKGVYSELFSCFNVIDLNEPVEEIKAKIKQRQIINPADIEQYIRSVRKLETLTHCQIKICQLDRMHRLTAAPAIVNLNVSSIYRNIWQAARKLNFNSLINFRVFIRNEYSNEELQLLL